MPSSRGEQSRNPKSGFPEVPWSWPPAARTPCWLDVWLAGRHRQKDSVLLQAPDPWTRTGRQQRQERKAHQGLRQDAMRQEPLHVETKPGQPGCFHTVTGGRAWLGRRPGVPCCSLSLCLWQGLPFSWGGDSRAGAENSEAAVSSWPPCPVLLLDLPRCDSGLMSISP